MFIFSETEFKNPEKIIEAFNKEQFFAALKVIDELKEEYYLAGYISYEAGKFFLNQEIKSKTPLLYFEAHRKSAIHKTEEPKKTANLYINEKITFDEYRKNFEKIKNYISQGSTYEVNYTYNCDVLCDICGYELYLNLIKNQKTPYCAYISNNYHEILSFSPELFFEIKNNKIITKPMKGTVKREGNDKQEIDFLRNDVKNRAENTMIVDLLRNDLSKIKEADDIKVEKLFEIETHKTLHQMTSTISAKLNKIDLADILKALFPCGSITGAPKISTMEIIEETENYKRDVYCGAIGVIHKNEMKFSVPIRILQRRKEENKFTFASGGAIVRKSDVKEEWEECRIKRAFLGQPVEFSLIETILINNNEPKFYKEYLERLKKSADELSFKFNHRLYEEKFKNNQIAKILLSKDGSYEIRYREIDEIKTNKIIVSDTKMYSKNALLYHKTSFRPWYQKSYELIAKGEIFDTVYFNEKDELTEGSRSNIILQKNNTLYTPKLNCGLLNGIMRQKLIAENKITEKTLLRKDLYEADKMFLINSVKGMVEVRL